MEPDDTPRPGQSRLSDVGDYEIFDGERWRPVAPLLADPEDANREGPDGRAEGVADATADLDLDLDGAFLRDGTGGAADLPSER